MGDIMLQGLNARWPTADGRAVRDADDCFVFGVDRVEVGKVVVAEIHVDGDPVELAESWHDANRRDGPKFRSREERGT